jgi:hypothetical protein
MSVNSGRNVCKWTNGRSWWPKCRPMADLGVAEMPVNRQMAYLRGRNACSSGVESGLDLCTVSIYNSLLLHWAIVDRTYSRTPKAKCIFLSHKCFYVHYVRTLHLSTFMASTPKELFASSVIGIGEPSLGDLRVGGPRLRLRLRLRPGAGGMSIAADWLSSG